MVANDGASREYCQRLAGVVVLECCACRRHAEKPSEASVASGRTGGTPLACGSPGQGRRESHWRYNLHPPWGGTQHPQLLVKGVGAEHYERLHQENFCQALGVVSAKKYQNEDGPSLKQCFDLLREASTAPVIDLQHLLNSVIFNYLIRNYDAHGKNFSVVQSTHGGYLARFSPLYDLVCTEYYPDVSKKMVMKIGREYLSAKVFPCDFEKLAEEAGLAKPLVKRRVPELAAAVIEALGKIDFRHPPPSISRRSLKGADVWH